MNSPGDGFVPPREKAAKRLTAPWGRFPASWENDASKFRECSLRNRVFSLGGKFTAPKGRFFPPREKIADNLTFPREKAWEGHVPPVRPIFPRGRPSFSRYKMMFPKNKFTFPKDMVGNKHVFPNERVTKMERPARCIIPPKVSLSQRWHVVQHKKNSPKVF